MMYGGRFTYVYNVFLPWKLKSSIDGGIKAKAGSGPCTEEMLKVKVKGENELSVSCCLITRLWLIPHDVIRDVSASTRKFRRNSIQGAGHC
jgi:hypothetical protein